MEQALTAMAVRSSLRHARPEPHRSSERPSESRIAITLACDETGAAPDEAQARDGRCDASDETLAQQARDGDQRAFAMLVRRYLRRALAVASEYASSLADAEDIVQDAFGRMYNGLGRFDAKRAFAPWFFTIVRNTARNAAKMESARKHVPITDDYAAAGASPARHAARAELRMRIRDAIRRLPPMQASCVRLCLIEGLTSVEAAAALDVAESTVRVHVFQARRTLQDLLDAWRSGVE